MPQSSISTHPFSDVPCFSKTTQPPGYNQQMVNSFVYHPCLSRLGSRLTLTFIRHLTLISSNLIKQKKIGLLFRIKFKQFYTFSAYSKLQCVFTLYVRFSLIILNIFVCRYCCKFFVIKLFYLLPQVVHSVFGVLPCVHIKCIGYFLR